MHSITTYRRQLDDVANRAGEIKRTEIADQRRLGPIGRAAQHIDLIVALDAHHGREQPDRTGAGHQQPPRLPRVEAPADAFDVVPRLGDHARRFCQDGQFAQCRIDLDRKARLDTKTLQPKPCKPLMPRSV